MLSRFAPMVRLRVRTHDGVFLGTPNSEGKMGNCIGVARAAVAVAALMFASAGPALAMPAPGSQAMAAPSPVTHGVATYVSGGIGRAEADVLRHMAARYPVEMTFAQQNQGRNEFVAGVDLRVTDSAGHAVVDVKDGGPLVLLRLPDGHYTLTADYDGHVKTQRVDVSKGHHDRIGFLWS